MSSPPLEDSLERARQLRDAGKFAEAEAIYRQLLVEHPNDPNTMGGFGGLLHARRQYQEAIPFLRAVAAARPGSGKTWMLLGDCLHHTAQVQPAIDAFRKFLEIRPDLPAAHYLLSLALMRNGQLLEGFKEHEHRWDSGIFQNPRLNVNVPEWNGEPLNGRHILLYAEQGFGDAIQFIRYARLVAEQRGGRVWVGCAPELHAILSTALCVEQVLADFSNAPPFAAKFAIMSLPVVFKTTLETIPAAVPYLATDPARVAVWRSRIDALGEQRRLNVGLVWAGRPTHRNDANRSIVAEQFRQLGSITGVRFFNLQKRIGGSTASASVPGMDLIDWTADLYDFADTAALVQNLDLVITVDTAVAHLAGALAKPVWVLLPHSPDFRWMMHREDSPWYPTMRLFRQPVAGNWSEPIERVIAELAKMAGRGGTAAAATASPANADVLHAQAVHLFESGKLSAAVDLLQRVVSTAPDNANYHSDLGTVLVVAGRPDEAIAAFRRAIAVNPQLATAHYNLGNALKQTGELPAAIDAYRRAAALSPNEFETHTNLGIALLESEEMEEAAAAFSRAAALRPQLPEAHTNLAMALLNADRADKAIESYRRALRIAPDNVVAMIGLGTAFNVEEQSESAIEIFQRVLARDADNADALHGLAIALRTRGRLDEAIVAAQGAIARRSEFPQALCVLGETLWEKGARDAAIDAYRKAFELRDRFPDAATMLGHALLAQNDAHGAIECFRAAVELGPDWAQAHYDLGVALLLDGQFKGGWAEHEWRLRIENFVEHQYDTSRPRWNGGPLDGRWVLFDVEQGHGDTFQFVRYARLVAEQRGGRVILGSPPDLAEFLSTAPGLERVVTDRRLVPADAVQCPLMSLPFVMGTELATVPADVPYLRADTARVERWTARLGDDRRPRVGVAWAGGPRHPNDKTRSIPVQLLEPLFQTTGIRFISLQKGAAAAALRQLPSASNVTDWTNDLRDFADTAALIAQLDLVIAVDTAVAHLAGALAKPVWVMLPFNPDFRWMLNRDDSPWYPTMRLFRQTTPGDWPSVIRRVEIELGKLAKGTR
jgi:tetratricopeptide (TPR) repeat protein